MPLIQKLLIILCVSLLFSCKNDKKNDTLITYVGGEIVNPKRDFVIIAKDGCVLDSVPLKKDNSFLFQSNDLKPGLYTFKHNEYQVIYLEPGDSLMLRVNTIDFDESLSYSGTGAEKNNLLMEMFLSSEKESKLMAKMNLLPPTVFQKKIDSLRTNRIIFYNDYKKDNPVSEGFSNVVKASIDYDYFSKKELYLSAYAARERFNGPEEFPDNFYDFRNKIDYNNQKLKTYYPYFLFLNRHFDNLAYQQYKDEHWFDRKSYTHNHHKMFVIDSLVTNDTLKNNLLRQAARRYLINGKNAQNELEFKNHFIELSSNESHKQEIEKLANAAINLTPGEKIPNVLLVTNQNENKKLRNVINKYSVLYFWSVDAIKHYRDIHSRAAELHDKFPEYDFIAINTDVHFKKWLKTIANNGYTITYEYQIEDIDDAQRKLVLNSMNKAIILDKSGTILENNANIFDEQIESLLLGYLNK